MVEMKNKCSEQLTIKRLEQAYKEVKKMPKFDSILVSRLLVRSLDGLWDTLSWLDKLGINMKRLFNGNGLYRRSSMRKSFEK